MWSLSAQLQDPMFNFPLAAYLLGMQVAYTYHHISSTLQWFSSILDSADLLISLCELI